MKTLAILLLAALCAGAADFDHSYAQFDAVLKKHVRNARVDYPALKAGRAPLDATLKQFGAVTEGEFGRWTQPQQLAFLINLYNAATLQLIIDHYPLRSIKDIGNILKGPWKQEVVPLLGHTTTLDYLEHGVLRKRYNEPRVHFAIVCASIGCPPLRAEAYTADRLDAQLADQGRAFLQTPEKNRVDAADGTLFLSPIFKWFSEDFEKKSGSVVAFVTPFFAPADQSVLRTRRDLKIRYTDYDWSLNDLKRR